MNKLEKLAYLKGLVAGLNLNDDKKDTKVIRNLMELLEDIVLDMENLEDGFYEFQQQLDEVDEDLGAIERDLYEVDGNKPAPSKQQKKKKSKKTKDELYYEVTCPTCGDTICLDEELINVGEMECPNCGEKLEFDLDN